MVDFRKTLFPNFRFLGIAMFDLILSMVLMIIAFVYLRNLHYPELELKNFVIAAILLTIPLGMIFHIAFGINSQINFKLGLSRQPGT